VEVMKLMQLGQKEAISGVLPFVQALAPSPEEPVPRVVEAVTLPSRITAICAGLEVHATGMLPRLMAAESTVYGESRTGSLMERTKRLEQQLGTTGPI
jgi:hypothetical protein